MTFAQNNVYVVATYVCDCGHKFTRKNSDYFTINPFNTKTPKECREDIIAQQSVRERDCPKCKKSLTPINKIK